MRRINILKTIVDYVWLVTVPLGTIVVISCIPGIFVIEELVDFMEFPTGNAPINIYTKLLMCLETVGFLLILLAFHLFRNALRYFQKVKIFDPKVIRHFRNIGTLLIVSGVISFLISVIVNIYYEGTIKLFFGFNEDIFLIVLGLFFQVLSEIFKIAKYQKEENELTI